MKNYLERIKLKHELIPSQYEGLLQVVEKDQCDIEVQKDNVKNYLCEQKSKSIYITESNNPEEWKSYSCKNDANLGGCLSETTFRRMALNYVFRTTEMYRYYEFEQAVQTLLERFYVDDSSKAQ